MIKFNVFHLKRVQYIVSGTVHDLNIKTVTIEILRVKHSVLLIFLYSHSMSMRILSYLLDLIFFIIIYCYNNIMYLSRQLKNYVKLLQCFEKCAIIILLLIGLKLKIK